MIDIVIDGKHCWLLPYMPNTDAAVRLGAKLPVKVTRSLTGRTSRAPDAVTLRHSLEWSADMQAAEFAALRNATQVAQNQPIVVPVWPFAVRIGVDASVITAGLVIAWTEDWATYAVNPVSLAGYDYAAPLLYGFMQPPSVAAQGDDLVTADFSVQEDAPVAYTFTPSVGVLPADATFNTALGFAAPIFPFFPDWSRAPKPGVALTEVEREDIGPGRQKAQTFYPQQPELVQQATFKFADAAAAAKLIAWWARRAAVADPHWVAGTQTVGRLSAAAAAGTNVLNFRDNIALGTNAYVALFSPDEALELGRISASAAKQITLAANLANTWGPSVTNVTHAILARHTDEELVLEFERARDGWIATSSLSWREVAPEYAPAEDETRGVTLGRLPGKAWFFQIDLDYNGALRSWYLTNFESGATANLIDWTYNACTFKGMLVESVDLEDDKLNLNFRYFAGGPWDNWLPSQLSARGLITIYRADVSAAGVFSNFRQFWKGELKTPQIDGPIVTQKAVGDNAFFARKGPRQAMIIPCGTMLFRGRCGLLLSDWKFNATIAAVAGNVVTIGTITRANGAGLPAGFGAVDWFALGWMEWLVAGAPIRDGILTSTEIAGGQVALTLERICELGVGSSVVAVPGCDLIRSSGCTKLGNTENFRGFDDMPAVNPSFILPERKTTAAKK